MVQRKTSDPDVAHIVRIRHDRRPATGTVRHEEPRRENTMSRILLASLCAAAALFASSLDGNAPQAASAGCIQYDPVPGTGNWRFRNHCGTRVEVAYCVRYQYGVPTMYVGRFSFNDSLTVRLANVPNQINFEYCPVGRCSPPTPPC
jgi:hypothetical protein